VTYSRDALEQELERDEAFVPHAYQDHLGFWTIGFGRLIDQRRSGGISRAEGLILLSNDITGRETVLDAAVPWWRQLSDGRQRALLNMAYQLGANGLLKFVATLDHLQGGRYAAAAESASRSLWAKQTPERAARVIAQLRDG
jgi:lysozyme